MSRSSADPTVQPTPAVVVPRLSVLAPASAAPVDAAAPATATAAKTGDDAATVSQIATGWSPTAWRIGRRS